MCLDIAIAKSMLDASLLKIRLVVRAAMRTNICHGLKASQCIIHVKLHVVHCSKDRVEESQVSLAILRHQRLGELLALDGGHLRHACRG